MASLTQSVLAHHAAQPGSTEEPDLAAEAPQLSARLLQPFLTMAARWGPSPCMKLRAEHPVWMASLQPNPRP